MDDADDWDNVPPPQSRSDRIQRITSPDSTLQRRPPSSSGGGGPGALHAGSSSSLARAAQQQQMQLAAALMQQQQLQQQLLPHHSRAGSMHHLDILLDQHQPPPSHLASLRRQAQLLALQAHTNSLPRQSLQAQHQNQLYNVPVSPTTSQKVLNQRYRSPSSLPPTTGQQLRPVSQGPLSPTPSSARRLSQRLEHQLEPPQGMRQLDSLSRRAAHATGPYWGQHESSLGMKGPFDPIAAAQQQAIYSGDGSTSSYARVNHNRQTYPPSQQSAQVEPIYNLQHDENTSLTSQKTSRTQASMLTKSAPTPSGSGTGSGSGSGSTPQQKQTSEATGSTTISASAKYAEYISNLEKYQHPPPSKRHVTFIKYRGRQCTIGMLVIFAVLVIGLVVAPVVYFTAFANKAQSSDSTPQSRLTNFINGQINLDTTHGAYADLMTDPGRPPDEKVLKRVQRDMEELLKDVLLGQSGFSADEINTVMVSQPQRPDSHQIFLRFQVLLKTAIPLDVAEAKTSKAFASATVNDQVGVRLKAVPIVANSLFFRAVPQTNASGALNNPADIPLVDLSSDAGSRPSDLLQFDPITPLQNDKSPTPPRATDSGLSPAPSTVGTSTTTIKLESAKSNLQLNVVAKPTPTLSVNLVSASTTTTTPTTTTTLKPSPTTSQTIPKTVTTTRKPQPATTPLSDLTDEAFGIGIGVQVKRTTTTVVPRASSTGNPWSPLPDERPSSFGMTVALGNRGEYSRGSTVAPVSAVVATSVPIASSRPSFSTLGTVGASNNPPPAAPNPPNFVVQGQGQGVDMAPGQRPPDFIQMGVDPVRDFTPSGNFRPGNNPNTQATAWENRIPFAGNGATRQPGADSQFGAPQFVTNFNQPQFTNQPAPFSSPNMQNPLDSFNPQFQGQPGRFNPNLQQNPPQFVQQNFDRSQEMSFNDNGFRLPQKSFSSSGPPQTFPLNQFAADDARATASATKLTTTTTTASTHKRDVKPSTMTTRVTTVLDEEDSITTIAPVGDLPTKGTGTLSLLDSFTETTAASVNTTSVLLPAKREFPSQPAAINLPFDAVKKHEELAFSKEFPEFSDSFSSTAPLLVSDWGNWSDWGACSASRCTSEGFQMRTRACMTSINGAPQVPDHDAACTANGGQGIEARPCICEHELEESSSSSTGAYTSSDPTTTTSDQNWSLPDAVPSTVALATSTATDKASLVWSDWTDWSTCSIDPCRVNGIQTRHRTCRVDDGTLVVVPGAANQMCFQVDGSNVDTRACDCVAAGRHEEYLTTLPTFARSVKGPSNGEGVPPQPQRAFSLQVQNRPIQRRPTSTAPPRTCSFYEKPCNSGQCILSYRICDGFPDCADGSDEPLGCGRCFSGEFKCTNGRCISETLVCDGTDNCGDGTDEYFC